MHCTEWNIEILIFSMVIKHIRIRGLGYTYNISMGHFDLFKFVYNLHCMCS